MKKHLQILMCFGFALFASHSEAQWNPDPTINTPVAIQNFDQQSVTMVTDTKSGGIIGWLDYRKDTARADIYTQRIDNMGNVKWTANGISACINDSNQAGMSSTEDGFGGVFFAWNDWRSGNRDIYAQKIDSNGTILWNPAGQPIAVKPYHQKTPKLQADGAGGVYITWIDSSNVTWDIYAQHVNASGTNMWAAAGVAICTASGSQTNPRIESDNNGGAIIVWQDKRNGSDYDIYAQKIDAAGNIKWSSNGVIVCSVIGTQSGQKIRSDGQGGVYVVWQDKRNGSDYNIYAQHLNASGTKLWTANGVLICNAAGTQNSIDITNENITNGIVISWKDERNGTTNTDIYAQKINSIGTVLWTANGVAVANAIRNQQSPNTCGDGTGGAIISYQDSSAGTWDIKCQRIDSIGNLRWTSTGVPIGTAAYSQTNAVNISDGIGGTIVAWQDKRNLTDWDVYANHYSPNWTGVGVKNTSKEKNVFLNVYPDPASSHLSFQINQINTNDQNEYTIDITDSNGKFICRKNFSNDMVFDMSTENFSNGMYFYHLYNSKKYVTSGKFIVNK